MWKQACAVLFLLAVAARASHVDELRLQRVKAAVELLRSHKAVHSADRLRRDGELAPMAYEEQIKEFLETLKELMRAPIDALGLPTLDPLEIPGPIDINLDSDMIQLAGNISNLRVDNLSRFETTSADFSIVGFKLSVAVFFDEIHVSGNYNLDGALMSGLLLVYGEGPFTISVRNASLSAGIAIKSTDNIPYIDTLDVDFDIPIVSTNFSGLLGGGDLSDVTNEIISDLVPEILDSEKERILGAIVPSIIEIANNALSDYTFNELICAVVGVFC